MVRIGLGVAVVGVAVLAVGYSQYKSSKGASTEPVRVTLEELEAGTAPPSAHLKLGPHVRLYPLCVYSYEFQPGGPGPKTKVNYIFYPVVSQNHPYLKLLAQGAENAQLKSFAVLVKTDSFRSVGAIPNYDAESPSLQGLVVNTLLSDDDRRAIRDVWKLDESKLVILAEGRKPAYKWLMGGGIAAIALGVLLILVKLFKGHGDAFPTLETPSMD
ncbi:MAG: hypothetical protein ABFD92_13660 [Planctomycetaceae bacterium]|nr:hypothetical protein [Planctomycetaceae bacterium]